MQELSCYRWRFTSPAPSLALNAWAWLYRNAPTPGCCQQRSQLTARISDTCVYRGYRSGFPSSTSGDLFPMNRLCAPHRVMACMGAALAGMQSCCPHMLIRPSHTASGSLCMYSYLTLTFVLSHTAHCRANCTPTRLGGCSDGGRPAVRFRLRRKGFHRHERSICVTWDSDRVHVCLRLPLSTEVHGRAAAVRLAVVLHAKIVTVTTLDYRSLSG